VATLRDPRPTIVGIDHAFSFPAAYFKRHKLPHDWPAFLDDFQRYWPTDGDHMYVDFVRDGRRGEATARGGSARWRRLTDHASGSAKSPFHFDVQGTVAKSTHAGLPWLRYTRQHARVHFGPFDGWAIPAGRSAVVEVYPRLWNRRPRPAEWTQDQFDAFVIAEWLRRADADGRLDQALGCPTDADIRDLAAFEGWILGVDPQRVSAATKAKYAESATRRRPKARLTGGATASALLAASVVPELSRFYGIVVAMYYREHGVPHFHASYGGFEASVEVESGLIRGKLPGRAAALVHEWLDLHRGELLDNWELARLRKPLRPVPPLE
jgi:hypothetical protein